MAKLIELEQAAQMLGLTPEELTEMRSRNDIFGIRDGSSWKFKESELERVAGQLGVTLGAAGASPAPSEPDSGDDFDLDLSDDSIELDGLDITAEEPGEGDSILVSEEELGKSDASSTIIGPGSETGASDIKLAETLEDGSELRLSADSATGSDLTVGASDILSPESDILAGDDAKDGPSDTANLLGGDSELKLASSSGSLDFSIEDSEISLDSAGSGINLDSDSASAGVSNSGFGSAIDLDLDDDELVLGSGTGSDVTSGAGDSGINLSNPADSGLSLEEPLDLSGGSSIESLELGEDDIIAVDEPADTEVPTDLGGDDDFLLTPMSDELDEESDSGSQVIDLDSEEFDESAATLLADNASPMDELEEGVAFETLDDDGLESLDGGLEELDGGFDGGLDDAPLGGASETAAGATALGTASKAAPEAHYSLANVLSLFAIACMLGVAGLMMLDLISNMWSWDQNYAFKSSLMDTIISMIPGQ